MIDRSDQSMLQRFFQANRALSRRFMRFFPFSQVLPFHEYEEVVVSFMNRLPKPVILDVGAGTGSLFSPDKPPGGRVICLDISREQLAQNRDADELLLADAGQEIPLPDASVDLVVSRAVIEHIKSPQDFFRHSHRVLKPGGYAIHVLPCKLAWFAIINRLLPQSLGRKILFYLKPSSRGEGGFPAFYHKCYYSGIRKILGETGFILKEARFYHLQHLYFDFFFPLFLLSAFYETLTLPIKNLCSIMLFVAQKSE